MSSYVTDGDEPAKALETKKSALVGVQPSVTEKEKTEKKHHTSLISVQDLQRQPPRPQAQQLQRRRAFQTVLVCGPANRIWKGVYVCVWL